MSLHEFTPKTVRVLVAGNVSYKVLEAKLNHLFLTNNSAADIQIVHTNNLKNSAENAARKWARKHSIQLVRFVPNWSDLNQPDAVISKNKYGKFDKKAGIRNTQSATEYATHVVIFDDNKKLNRLTKTVNSFAKAAQCHIRKYAKDGKAHRVITQLSFF